MLKGRAKSYCERCLGLDLMGELLREFAFQREKFLWRSLGERLAEKGILKARPSGKEGPGYEETLLDKYLGGWEDLDDQFAREALIKFIKGEGIHEVVQTSSTYGAREDLRRKVSQALGGGGEAMIEAAHEIALQLQDRGYLKLEAGKPLLTSSGVKVLSREALRRALKRIGRRGAGVHEVEKLGLGGTLDPRTRPYEWGDDYPLIDIEETLSTALARKGTTSEIEAEDVRVHDTWHESRLLIGLLIDISGSMRSGGKLEAALETSIALSALAARRPRDIVKMYTFSDTVKETSPAAIINRLKQGYTTDIARGLRAFRTDAAAFQMEKIAYLITDMGANTEEGTFLGFARARKGVLREILKYREKGITLNIILLEQKQELVSFARQTAAWSAGRLFITAPDKLAQLVIGDFASRRGS